MLIDPVDYLTQQIYFAVNNEITISSVTGEKIQKIESFFEKVDEYELLRDVDYFIKKIEVKEHYRAKEIERVQKGEEG